MALFSRLIILRSFCTWVTTVPAAGNGDIYGGSNDMMFSGHTATIFVFATDNISYGISIVASLLLL